MPSVANERYIKNKRILLTRIPIRSAILELTKKP